MHTQNSAEKSYTKNSLLKLEKNYLDCQKGFASRHCRNLLDAPLKPLDAIVMFGVLAQW